jgi:NADPH2:quinone reductase
VDALTLVDTSAPAPGRGQVAVQVLAAAGNFPDVLMCRGLYQVRPELPFVPGVEACGTVVGLGDGVDPSLLGQRVIGGTELPHGSFAEVAIMPADQIYPAPSSLDDAQAAALLVAYQTGWFALHRRARIQPGETLLVHAAAGGVGSAAIELGKAAGATVIAVVGGEAKRDTATSLGADIVVDRSREDFVAVVKDATGGRGADVIFDPVGGETYRKSTKCIAFEGRIVIVGFTSGEIQSVALNHALVKNYSILGLHWGLYRTEDPTAVRDCMVTLTDLANEGRITPLVSQRHGFTTWPAAMQELANGTTVGRLALIPSMD